MLKLLQQKSNTNNNPLINASILESACIAKLSPEQKQLLQQIPIKGLQLLPENDFQALYLPYLKTRQESKIFKQLFKLATYLGRIPSGRELANFCNQKYGWTLCKDRFIKIIAAVNSRLPEQIVPLQLTHHRSHAIHFLFVTNFFINYLSQHGEPPSSIIVKKQLKSKLLTPTYLEIKSILALIRAHLDTDQHWQWRISRRKIKVVWNEIISAYQEAKRILTLAGVKKNPCAEQVSLILEKKGKMVQPCIIRFRAANNNNSNRSCNLASYFDPTTEIIQYSFIQLFKKLGRAPNISELKNFANKMLFTELSVDALAARIARINQGRTKKSQLKLEPTLKSKVYDTDIMRIFKLLSGQHKRAPTFAELHSAVLSKIYGAKIRADTFFRRVRKLNIKLSNEKALNRATQAVIGDTIKELALELIRQPNKMEVINRLALKKIKLNEAEFFRYYGNYKKNLAKQGERAERLARRSLNHQPLLEAAYQLEDLYGRPATKKELITHLKLQNISFSEKSILPAFRIINTSLKLGEREPKYSSQHTVYRRFYSVLKSYKKICHEPPSLADLAAKLGWQIEGVREALKYSQRLKIKHRQAPLVLGDTNLELVVQTIKSRAYSQSWSDSKRQELLRICLSAYRSDLADHDEIEFGLDLVKNPDILKKMCWLNALYLSVLGNDISELDKQTINYLQISWAKIHDLPTLVSNPLASYATVFYLAYLAGNLTKVEICNIDNRIKQMVLSDRDELINYLNSITDDLAAQSRYKSILKS